MATAGRFSEAEEKEELTRLRGELERIQTEIEDVQREIDSVKRQLEAAEARGDDMETIRYLRDEKNMLREKENKLHEKENKLRDKENKLRDEKNILLGLQQHSEASRLIEAWKATEKVLVEGQKELVEGQKELVEGQKELVEVQKDTIKLLEEGRTESKSMSKANMSFTEELLSGLGITWEELPADETPGENYEFSWSGGKHERTTYAMQHLASILGDLVVDGKRLGLFDARQLSLYSLKANHKMTTGKSDLGIASLSVIKSEDINNLKQALALIELKSTGKEISSSQLLLELASLSRMSAYGQGAVLLGTNCATGWRLAYYPRRNHMSLQSFFCGSRCLDILKDLLMTVTQRKQANQQLMQMVPIPEVRPLDSSGGMGPPVEPGLNTAQEQDLSGFETTPREEALDREAFLQQFAHVLTEWTGGAEVPVVPEWARADAGPSFPYFA